MFDARPNLASANGGGSTPASKGGWADKTSAGGVVRNYVLSSSISSAPRASLASRLRESLFSMERLQELRQETQAKMRPWTGDFFNREHFSMPEGLSMAQNRLSNNLRYYQSNYLIVVLLLFCYCVITHIFLAVVIAGMALGFFYVSSLPQDYNTQVGGMLITKRTLNLALIIVGVFIFLFSGISSTFFWLVGISALIVGAHAACHEVSIESDFGGGSGAPGIIA